MTPRALQTIRKRTPQNSSAGVGLILVAERRQCLSSPVTRVFHSTARSPTGFVLVGRAEQKREEFARSTASNDHGDSVRFCTIKIAWLQPWAPLAGPSERNEI